MEDGKGPKERVGTKGRRVTPTISGLELVTYELLSLLEEDLGPGPSERRVRLRDLKARIAGGQFLARETAVAQDLAEEDGEAIE